MIWSAKIVTATPRLRHAERAASRRISENLATPELLAAFFFRSSLGSTSWTRIWWLAKPAGKVRRIDRLCCLRRAAADQISKDHRHCTPSH